ncbi:MAG: HAD family hydrolase [Planctomycetota bacterium]
MNGGLDLFIDADDTLWENARYFHVARDHFIQELAGHGFLESRVRSELSKSESQRLARSDFGSSGLAASMHTTAAVFDTALADDLRPRFRELSDQVRHHDILAFPEVPETLDELGKRHRLHLVTMGDHKEQLDKLERSALLPRFSTFEIMPDKTPASYLALVRHHGISNEDRHQAWMIGNSLKKDIEPAAAVGLSTAHIPSAVRLPAFFEESERRPDLSFKSFSCLKIHF